MRSRNGLFFVFTKFFPGAKTLSQFILPHPCRMPWPIILRALVCATAASAFASSVIWMENIRRHGSTRTSSTVHTNPIAAFAQPMLECLSSAQLPAQPAKLCGRMWVLHGWVAEVAVSELLTQLGTSQDDVFRPGGGQVEVQVVAVHSPDLGGLHRCLVHSRLESETG